MVDIAVVLAVVLMLARLIAGSGGDSLTTTYPSRVVESVPATLEAVSETVYVPAVSYVFTGFSDVENVPSPKSQDHVVGLPVEVSVKVTASGAAPDVGVPTNEAVGGTGAGVWVGVGVGFAVGVGVGIGVAVGVGVGVDVGVGVGPGPVPTIGK
jgi:hypothetical protein